MDDQQSDAGSSGCSQEIVNLDHSNELVDLLPKYFYHSMEARTFRSAASDLQDFKIKDIGSMTDKTSLIDRKERDEKGLLIFQLVAEALCQELEGKSIQDFEEKENRDPNITKLTDHRASLRLLHHSCKVDSVECAKSLIEGEFGTGVDVNEMDEFGRTALHSAAEMHATRCISLLLSKHARTDIRSNDGKSQLALETALSSNRIKLTWTADDTVEDLLVLISGMELSAVRMLVEKTTNIAEVAYASAMEGRVISLAVLLSMAPEKVTASITVLRPPDGALSSKEATNIYECVIREALSLGQKESSRGARRSALSNSEKRKLLLCEIELLQLFEAAIPKRGSTDRKVVSPLVRASQAGDEEVIELLLKTNIDVNETDGEGNSALHCYLRTSSNTKKPRILLLLLKNGANVRQRNRLGLTPLHVAAAKGSYQALQILLLQDPECVDAFSEMRETPLFFAVKNDFMNCAKLLLRHGANSQLLNLRKQRPIDLAKSQDMRFLLSQMCIQFFPSTQESISNNSFADEQCDFDGELFDAFVNAQIDSTSAERFYPGAKTQICRYFQSPSGCARGAKCHYAHGVEELLGSCLGCELKQGGQTSCSPTKELKRKIFIGGLPPSVHSDTLKDFFECKFGSVEEAIVIRSQAGDHMLSRGFGFVTFKNEESVAAAVEAHYVVILGKKVEIKGAVPKPISILEAPTAETGKQLQYNLQILNNLSGRSKGDGSCRSLESDVPYLDRLLGSSSLSRETIRESHVNFNGNSGGDETLPSWVITFKKWLPGFLNDVSKRLKEGEWYPLSSLKGDFRATCGLELDHASLGYIKLSDFMRSFSGICRMKIVPVGGRGPATHMVLLPNLPCSQQHQQHQQLLTIKGPHLEYYYSQPSLFDENDDDNDLKLFESLVSAASLGHTSRYDTSSSAPRQKEMRTENTTEEESAALENYSLFFTTRPVSESGQEEEGGEDNSNPRHVILGEFNKEKGGFSLFQREYDFFKIYRENVAKQICFRCKKKKMLWVNKPCEHPCWCSDCKRWALRQAHPQCVICDRNVIGYGFKAWGALQMQQEAPPVDEKPDSIMADYDANWPPMAPAAGRARQSILPNKR